MRFSAAALFGFLASTACAIPTEVPSPAVERPVYGSVVDTTHFKPATTSTPPGTLLNRNAGVAPTFTAGGNWSETFSGSLGGNHLLV
jgi:hypothetical protein